MAGFNATVGNFLRFLCIVDGRDAREIRSVLGCSVTTVKRYVRDARVFGCEISYDRFDGCYRMSWSGPFDLGRLRLIRWKRV